MLSAGELDRRVRIERATVTTDAHGGEVHSHALLTECAARISWGTAVERRTAAQEASSGAVSVRIRWSAIARTIGVKDRLVIDGQFWDITSVVPFGRNLAIDITAMRSR